MCNLCGVAGHVSVPAERAIGDLLVYGSVRGTDSTGIASVPREDKQKYNWKIAKELFDPYNLFNTVHKKGVDYDKVLSGNHRLLMGHNRAGTRGSTNLANAHPFNVGGEILGTHNGTINGHRNLPGGLHGESDSLAIMNSIAEIGIEETIGHIEDDGFNAYALAVYDARDDIIRFIRNAQRELYLWFTDDKRMLFWASEACHLWSALTRRDIKMHDKPFLLKPDNLYTYKLPDSNQIFNWDGEQVRPVKGKEKKKYVTPASSGAYGFSKARNHSSKRWDHLQGKYIHERWNSTTNSYEEIDPGELWDEEDQASSGRLTYSEEKRLYNENLAPPYSDVVHWSNGVPWRYSQIQKSWVNKWVVDKEEADQERELIALGDPKSPPKLVVVKNTKDEDNIIHLPAPTTRKKEHERVQKALADSPPNRPKSDLPIVWQDKDNIVNRDPKSNEWVHYRYIGKGAKGTWLREVLNHCPHFVPCTVHDIPARHFFTKIGELAAFKGVGTKRYGPKAFNRVMQGGCVGCARIPHWGNFVEFLNDKDEFLCEYCAKDEDLTQKLKEIK